MNNYNPSTTTVRITIDTYDKLDKLRRLKKIKNLREKGLVGDADFDGIINDLLKKYYEEG